MKEVELKKSEETVSFWVVLSIDRVNNDYPNPARLSSKDDLFDVRSFTVREKSELDKIINSFRPTVTYKVYESTISVPVLTV